MRSIVSVDPFRCRMWLLSDRLSAHITEATCTAEIHSMAEHGQLVPALGRPLRGDSAYDVELICGARRLFVARHLRRPLLIELREMTDREAIIAMDIENRQRKDVSAYECGRCYLGWLRAGYFESQEDLADALAVSPAQVSRAIKMARLPSVVVDAFGSAVSIREGWGLKLVDAIEDLNSRKATVRAARELTAISPRPPARQVFRLLLSASVQGRRPRWSAHDQVVRSAAGEPLLRVSFRSKSIALIVPNAKLSAAGLEAIRAALINILDAPDRHGINPVAAVRPSTRSQPAQLCEQQ